MATTSPSNGRSILFMKKLTYVLLLIDTNVRNVFGLIHMLSVTQISITWPCQLAVPGTSAGGLGVFSKEVSR